MTSDTDFVFQSVDLHQLHQLLRGGNKKELVISSHPSCWDKTQADQTHHGFTTKLMYVTKLGGFKANSLLLTITVAASTNTHRGLRSRLTAAQYGESVHSCLLPTNSHKQSTDSRVSLQLCNIITWLSPSPHRQESEFLRPLEGAAICISTKSCFQAERTYSVIFLGRTSSCSCSNNDARIQNASKTKTLDLLSASLIWWHVTYQPWNASLLLHQWPKHLDGIFTAGKANIHKQQAACVTCCTSAA